jgi:hypothetical protein
MKRSSIPQKFSMPFAAEAGVGYIEQIPDTPSGTPGKASLQTGFPPENWLPIGAGGTPPWGADFNGILNQITLWNQWQAAGGPAPYDATFQSDVGGYPDGALVLSLATEGLVWQSIVDDNLTNPDSGGAGWIAFSPRSVPSPTLWVRTDGNDNNGGGANTAASALKTVSGALSKAASVFNLTGRTLTIRLGLPGTYDGFVLDNVPNVLIQGDAANQDAYVLAGDGVGYVQGANLQLQGVNLSNTGTANHTLQAAYGGSILLNHVTFTSIPGLVESHMTTFIGGVISVSGSIKINGPANTAFMAFSGGFEITNGSSITLVGNPTFADSFVVLSQSGKWLTNYTQITITGTAVGRRYRLLLMSLLDTGGAGVNYLPGTIAGTEDASSVYN